MRKLAAGLFFACVIGASSPLIAAGGANVLPTGESGSLRLGSNWYAYESFAGASFRWVDDNAELIVSKQPTNQAKLVMTVEPGPSMGKAAFPMYVIDSQHHVVDTIQINHKTTAQITLPVSAANSSNPYAESVFSFHVDSANKAVPKDSRHLNFRVFNLADLRPIQSAGGNDVVDPHNFVRVGDGWYPAEHANNATFRWIDNDAHFYVLSDKDQNAPIRVLFAPGPGVEKNYTLKILDGSGKEVGHIDGSGGGQKRFEQKVDLKTGDNEFTLHLDGGGKHVGSEPHRVLNFRVFSLAAIR